MSTPAQYLRPEVLAKISRLDLRARLIVEGFLAGLHKSPFHGYSVEFAQHREYAPGDDIRHVDWKVFARTDRFTIKQYEEETNLRAHLLVDASESMGYGSGPLTKFEYASCLAASLAYLLLQQQDSVGLALFNEAILTRLDPSNRASQIQNLTAVLQSARPAGQTDPERVLEEFAGAVPPKGMVIVVSDLLADADRVLRALRRLRHRRHEVLVFHVLDADEVSFPFRGNTMFEGMEGIAPVLADASGLRESYLEALNAFVRRLRNGCLASRIDYALLNTGTPLDVALSRFLARRAKQTQ